MEPTISKAENSISELEVDVENDGIENNTLDVNSKTDSEFEYGLCPECNKLNTYYDSCNQFNAKWFQQDFPNWTSGNKYIDNFIQESQLNTQKYSEVLEWIPYNRLTNIKYLAKGGFSTVYKAIWLDGEILDWDYDKSQWNRYTRDNIGGYEVVIKSLNNSSNINDEFLNEWKFHFNCYKKAGDEVVRLFGFTQDPNNLDYMIVMNYADGGSLRNSLKNTYSWSNILRNLNDIISGLDAIHESKLVHCDLHDGNVLCGDNVSLISDLGLSKPIDYFQNKSESVYGVIPYMAPEVLRGKPYTPASDIYSFAMIMWEFTSGVPPFDDRPHDFHLSLGICKGERPEIIEGTPQCYIDLMKKCWDLDPLKRPSASEIKIIIFNKWWDKLYDIKRFNDENDARKFLETIEDEQLRKDIEEFWRADKVLKEKQNNNSKTSDSKPITKSHPQAYHTSRLLGFSKQLNDILEKEIYGNKEDIKVETYETGGNQSIDVLNLTEEDINEALKDAENETQSDNLN